MKKSLYSKLCNYDISIILFFLSLFCLGVFSLFTSKVSFMPRYNESVLTIFTDYYGMDPEIIEEIITRPIERALKEIKGVRSFYSYSSKGRSKILVYLSPDEDVDEKVVLIYDSIRHISEKFPPEVLEPRVFKYNTDDKPLMIVSLTPKKFFEDELYTIVEHRIKPQILSLEGIADVEITGIPKEEYFIEQRYENLVRLNRDYNTIFEDITMNNVSFPLGKLKFGSSIVTVSFPNKYKNLLELPFHPYNFNAKTIFGYDLFSIEKRSREPDRISLINNKEAMILHIYKRDFSNIIGIDKGVQKILEEWKHIFKFEEIHNQVKIFKNLLRQLEIGICLSLLCILLIMLLFYKNIYYAFFCVLTIPLCFAATSLVLKVFSKSLNIMSLSGLIVGIGICVDSTIIVVDTIRHNARTGLLESAFTQSVQKIHKPIFSSTLTTIIVFVPLFFLYPGKISLYADFALSLSSMLVVSYLISILFIPALFSHLSKYKKLKGKLFVWSKSTFINTRRLKYTFLRYIAGPVFKNPVISICVFFMITGVCAWLLFTLEYSEVASLKVNEYEIYFDFNPGYTTEHKKVVIRDIGEKITSLKLPMKLVSKLENDRATFLFRFNEKDSLYRDRVQMLQDCFLEIKREDGFFHFQKEKRAGTGSVVVYFFGDNLDELNTFVDTISDRISGFYGTSQILKGYRMGKPEIQLRLDPIRMRYYKLDTIQVIRFLRYVLHAPVIMKFFNGERIVDVRGSIKTYDLKSEKILDLRIQTSGREYISLSDFSNVKFSESHGSIYRRNGKRCITLDIRYEGVKGKSYLRNLFSFLESLHFKGDFYYEMDEEIVENKKSKAIFIFIICSACFLVWVVLGNVLKSFKYPLFIILQVPSIFVGSYFFLKAGNFGQSVPVHIALIMLTGLSVNAAILLFDEVINFREKGPRRALLLGYSRKIQVIGMTLLTTIFSVIPVFFLATSTYFFKILAGVFFTGLLSSVFLMLVIFPAFYILLIKNS